MLQQLSDCHTLESVFEKAGLLWLAEPVPIMTADGKAIESHKAIRREDTGDVLGIVGRKYHIIQHSEAFAVLDVIANKYRAIYRTAGMIDNGRRVVIQAKLGNAFDVRPGDTHEKYLTVVNSFDGGLACKVYFTAVRLFCLNQLHASLRNHESCISIRHTASADDRIREGLRIFNMAGDYYQEYRDLAMKLHRRIVDKAMVRRFLDSVIGEADSTRRQNQRDKVVELFESGRGNQGHTAYDLLNGLTEYVDHYRNDDNVDSMLFGSGAALKEKAFQTALAL
jgi:phage/plasmid-like protein (TIGR03299 family)